MRHNHSLHWSQLALGIVVVLMMAALGSRDTWATYTSQAVSEKNVMRGGSIELSVLPDTSPDGRAISLTADSEWPYGVVVKNDGRSVLGYRARFIAGGDTDFCEALHLTAKREGKHAYAGALVNFEYASEKPLVRHQTDAWQFSIGMPESVSGFDESATCNLRWRVDAWQDRFLMLGMGWYDGVEDEAFTLSIEPAQDPIPETKESALSEPPLVSTVDETVISDDLSVPSEESVSDPTTVIPLVPEAQDKVSGRSESDAVE